MLVRRREAARKRPKPTSAPVVRGGGGKGWSVRADADEEEEATSTSAEETETETETEDDDDDDDREGDGIGVSKAIMMRCESYDGYLRAKPETRRRRLREAETERVGRPSRASVGNDDDDDDGEGSPRKTWYHTGPRERIVAPSRKRMTPPTTTTRKSKPTFDEALASAAALARAARAFGSGAGRPPKDEYGRDQACVMCDALSTPQWRIFPQRFVAPYTCAAGRVVCNKCYAKAKRAAARRLREKEAAR